MDNYYQEQLRGEMKRRDKRVTKNLSFLHQNMQSISNKKTELNLVLKSRLKDIEMLFYTAMCKGGLCKLNSDRSV